MAHQVNTSQAWWLQLLLSPIQRWLDVTMGQLVMRVASRWACQLWSSSMGPWHDMNYVEKPPVTVLIPAELCTTEEVEPVVEGLVTVTLKRVHGRLKKAQESSNHGRILKYTQGKNWLCTMLTHLPGSNFERNRVMESLAGDKVAVRLV